MQVNQFKYCSKVCTAWMIASMLCPIWGIWAQDSYHTTADSNVWDIDLDAYIVTAQYRPTHYKRALHKIGLIQSQQLTAIGVTSLDQALQISPSIRIDQDGVLGSGIRMRGISSSNVAILLDGVPLNGRLDGVIDVSQLPISDIQRVEIVEGPLSNLYGSNAAGGVINLISKTNSGTGWNLSTDHQIESVGKRQHYLSVGYKKGNWSARLYGRLFSFDYTSIDSLRLVEISELSDGSTVQRSKYPWNPKDQWNAGAQIGYQWSRQSLRLDGRLNHEDVADYGQLKRPNYKPYAFDDFYTTDRRDLALHYKGDIKERIFMDVTLGYNRFDRAYDGLRYEFDQGAYLEEAITQDASIYDTWTQRASATYRSNSLWEWTLGYQGTQEIGSGGRIYDPTFKDSASAAFNEWAVFSDVRYTPFKDLTLSASIRRTDHSRYHDEWTPAFHLKWTPSESWTYRMSYAQGYRSPSLKELYIEFIDVNHNIVGNPDLTPERSRDLSASLSYAPAKRFDISLNFYRTQIYERITLANIIDTRYSYINESDYRVYGGGTQMHYQWGKAQFKLAANLGYWQSSLSEVDDKDYSPVFDANGTFLYEFPARIKTTINYRYTGRTPVYVSDGTSTRIERSSALDMVDIGLSRSFWTERITVSAGVRNLLNVQYRDILNGTQSGSAHQVTGSQPIDIGRSWWVRLALEL